MLYSIVGIGYHKNRSVSTKNFEDVLISAACKKKKWKIWQKERELGGASPLDKKTSIISLSVTASLFEDF